MNTVFVMMSGGVDSSVAAFLLAKNKKYKVIGCFIKGYNIDGCQERDAEDARRTAEYLKIPFYAIDLENEYKKLVVDYMIDGYRRGITPNPDVMCNKEIKFGLFLEKALEMGADYVATGHYVRLVTSNQQSVTRNTANKSLVISYQLLVARDLNKDQSYFLWTLTQKQLKHCLFPIGDYLKSEVREIARKAGLPTADKKDSQGICFLGKVSFNEFLRKYIPEKMGDILNINGEKIGKHKGAHFYTIGQRHIGIMNYESGIRGRQEIKPLYVVKKDIKKNTLMVAEGSENSALYRKEIELTNINFINQNFHSLIRANKRIVILTRVRYRQPLVFAKFIIHNSKFIIQFKLPVKFVAPGQSAVFYLPADLSAKALASAEALAKAGAKKGPADAKAMAGKEMLGGGIII